jgi:hypothetical protein
MYVSFNVNQKFHSNDNMILNWFNAENRISTQNVKQTIPVKFIVANVFLSLV